MPSATTPEPPILAAVDIGSNSFRLELGQLHCGRYRRVQYLKRVVRLGADLDENSHLREPGIVRGLECLAEFAKLLKGFPAAHVRAVATQTLREAANRDAFLQRAAPALGYPIEIISGREEARLIYAGVSCLQPSTQPRLVIDIGGRSTELILGAGRSPETAESFAVGSVSLSMRFFADGRLTPEAFRAAQVAAGAEFEEAFAIFTPDRWQEALGASGTAGAVSDVLRASKMTDGRITLQGLAQLIEMAIRAGHVDEVQAPGLKQDRRAVLPGGLCILYTLLAQFGLRELLPAKGALRQGVIVDLQERLEAQQQRVPHDMRDSSVAELQARFGVDAAQAGRVSSQALALFDQLSAEPDAPARRELGWVCALHELGLVISHHDHHRHSAYVLGHADAPGFSQSQQRRLADLVLAQRGGLRKVEALLRETTSAWMVLCLRLAIIRCHARQDPVDGQWQLQRKGVRNGVLRWRPSAARPNPRTLYLLKEEAQVWARHAQFTLELPA
jgi:exopolyphosphatase/guanosine-5'-triphosphate,3'-diphosphate pyrophosphatase